MVVRRLLIMTHSDPRTDSRILKTEAVAKSMNISTLTLGVEDTEARTLNSIKDVVALRSSLRNLRDKFNLHPKPGSIIAKLFFAAVYFELSVKLIGRTIVFRPNIIHCNDWFLLPVAVCAKWISKARLIYDAHELESQTPPNPNFSSSFVEKLERALWPSIDFFTTVSAPIDNWYQEKMGSKESEVILNSPRFEHAKSVATSPYPGSYFRERFGIPPGTKIYLYIGLLGPGRGIETILEAFSLTPTNSAVVFMGYGTLQHEIVNQGRNSNNVFFHERVNHEQVVSLAQHADFGLCMIENASLSDYYCIPNKLLEYAFSGLPVVASQLPEIQKIVDDYGIGQCFDNSTQELLKVLDRNTTQDKVNRATRKDLRELSWEAQSQKLAKVFLRASEGRFKEK